MENKKHFSAYNVAIMIAMIFHYSHIKSGDSTGIKLWAPAGTAALKLGDQIITKHTPTFLKALEALNNVSAQIEPLSNKAVEASAKVGVEAATQFAEVGKQLTKVAGVGVAIYGVTQLYPIAKDIKSHWFPTTSQQLKEIMAMQRLQMIKAETSFRNCLIDNRFGVRGRSGIPMVCESAAEMFATLGQREEAERSIAYFNKCRERD